VVGAGIAVVGGSMHAAEERETARSRRIHHRMRRLLDEVREYRRTDAERSAREERLSLVLDASQMGSGISISVLGA